MKDIPDRGSAHELLILYRLDQTYWGKKIIAAEQAGEFDAQDFEDANCWLTCACGKLSGFIERGVWEEPKDEALYRLGMKFTKLVNFDEDEELCFSDRVFEVAETLIDIEDRASELARQHAHSLS